MKEVGNLKRVLKKKGREEESNNAYTHGIHGNGIFPYIWLKIMVNVCTYTIHGSYGIFLRE